MKPKRWLWSAALSISVGLGLAGGLALAVFTTPTPAWAGVFAYNQIAVISWRGGGDSVPAAAATRGWPAPMFYTAPEEGALPGGPEGSRPTGVWAPGDTVSRTLMVKNIDPTYLVQIDRLQVALQGDMGLAPWFSLVVTGPNEQELYRGSLADLASGILTLPSPVVLPRNLEQAVRFEATLNLDTDQGYQGRTVKADLSLWTSPVRGELVIDIHPSSWPNPINPGARGSIPVAINGSATLHVRSINSDTVQFGPNQIRPLRPPGFEDWNGDGREDMILHFDTRSSGIGCGMTLAVLTAASYEGVLYEAADAIVTRPCR
jgi:hypothetical protein